VGEGSEEFAVKPYPRTTNRRGWSRPHLVELLGRYSDWTSWTDRLPATDKTGELSRESRSRARRTARRLSESDVAELVTRYQEGATVYDLAKRFSIHRTTVSGREIAWPQP